MRVYQGKLPLHFVTTAKLAHQVLTGDTDKFDKGLFIDKLRLAFGNGLVSTDGEFHRRPPRMIQPTFHRRPLTRYSETMTALAADPANSWRDGQVLELGRVMQDLAITVIGRTLFSTDFARSVSAEIRAHTPTLIRLGVVRAPVARRAREAAPAAVLAARDHQGFAPLPVVAHAAARRHVGLLGRCAGAGGPEVGFSPHALHYDPRYYDDPARFDPAVGTRDAAVCGLPATDCSTSETLRAAEAPYFRSPLRACALSGYGHSMNLAPNARDYCSAVSSWVSQEVGR
ncbi:hypothetical protein ABTZ99_38015 [Actinosynnema sp. NPDC002837]